VIQRAQHHDHRPAHGISRPVLSPGVPPLSKGVGLGDEFDETKLVAYPPGAVVVLPGGTRHFHWAKSGEYVTQVTATGPISLEYVNPGDDPRRQ
jgi:hypothetical protein